MRTNKNLVEEPQAEELFSLAIVRTVVSRGGTPLDVPLVNGWVQLAISVVRVPSIQEELAFYAALARLVRRLRSAQLLSSWFLLHKSPGILLRFQSQRRAQLLVSRLMEQIPGLTAPWTGTLFFDSYFEQRELLSTFYTDTAARLLSTSSDALLRSRQRLRYADEAAWARFAVDFLDRFLKDKWHVWEALGRFSRLRGALIDADGASPGRAEVRQRLLDPTILAASLARDVTPPPAGFLASAALLQCLNYMFNQWMISAAAQRRVLQLARQETAPGLIES